MTDKISVCKVIQNARMCIDDISDKDVYEYIKSTSDYVKLYKYNEIEDIKNIISGSLVSGSYGNGIFVKFKGMIMVLTCYHICSTAIKDKTHGTIEIYITIDGEQIKINAVPFICIEEYDILLLQINILHEIMENIDYIDFDEYEYILPDLIDGIASNKLSGILKSYDNHMDIEILSMENENINSLIFPKIPMIAVSDGSEEIVPGHSGSLIILDENNLKLGMLLFKLNMSSINFVIPYDIVYLLIKQKATSNELMTIKFLFDTKLDKGLRISDKSDKLEYLLSTATGWNTYLFNTGDIIKTINNCDIVGNKIYIDTIKMFLDTDTYVMLFANYERGVSLKMGKANRAKLFNINFVIPKKICDFTSICVNNPTYLYCKGLLFKELCETDIIKNKNIIADRDDVHKMFHNIMPKNKTITVAYIDENIYKKVVKCIKENINTFPLQISRDDCYYIYVYEFNDKQVKNINDFYGLCETKKNKKILIKFGNMGCHLDLY